MSIILLNIGECMEIKCVIERIIYQNEDNGFSVMKGRVSGYSNLVPLVGNLFGLSVGMSIKAIGDWKLDAKFGNEFEVEKWEELIPTTKSGIERFLSGGLISGIGPATAKLIVSRFGDKTLDIIENDISQLTKLPGIGLKKVLLISKSWNEHKEMMQIISTLQEYEITTKMAVKIYNTYGKESKEIIETNPYQLVDEVEGIGFRTADDIALKVGFEKVGYPRIRSGLIYTFTILAEKGHVFGDRESVLEEASKLLECEKDIIEDVLNKLITKYEIIDDEGALYYPPFYYAEIGVSNKLRKILSTSAAFQEEVNISIKDIEKKNQVKYDDVQIEAIRVAITNKVVVITGGPGTGKTTIVKGIITALSSYKLKVLLAAPTGRAAKRMYETTGLPAKTIHRLLEYNPQNGFVKNDANLLDGDCLIVDESSMIDIILMNNLLKALPDTMRVILVGDIDQLPSVGPGNVLRDIIDSKVIPVVRLTKIYRQAMKSKIIINAHNINEGKYPEYDNSKDSDFFFIEAINTLKIPSLICDLVSTRLPNYYGISPEDIQVLSPMQKGDVGTVNLNYNLQQVLNPNKEGIKRSAIQFCVGDRVMQIKNNYDKDVFNGDIGFITEVDLEENSLTINFDDREIYYSLKELDEIVHAYAVTVHKSQGSEYPVVILPIVPSHAIMLQRNLLYTGITRAKKLLILVGSKLAIERACKNDSIAKRNTKLKERLQLN